MTSIFLTKLQFPTSNKNNSVFLSSDHFYFDHVIFGLHVKKTNVFIYMYISLFIMLPSSHRLTFAIAFVLRNCMRDSYAVGVVRTNN